MRRRQWPRSVAVGSGELTPAEAGELSRLVENYVKTIEATEIERRLQVLKEDKRTMRRNVLKRVELLEEKAGIGPEPPPSIFFLFPDGEPTGATNANFRYGCDWKRRPDEKPAEYDARIGAQLVAEGGRPPFILMVFDNSPRANAQKSSAAHVTIAKPHLHGRHGLLLVSNRTFANSSITFVELIVSFLGTEVRATCFPLLRPPRLVAKGQSLDLFQALILARSWRIE